MSKFWSGVVAASFVATVGLSAQEPAPGGGAVGTAGAQAGQQAGQAKSITVSGCIQNAPAATASAGAGGATATATSAPKFVLAMKPASGAAGGAVGTGGSAATRYALDGEEKTISPHLNHQVEITGTVQGGSAAGAGGASASAGPTLKVESVKMVAATCS